MIVQNGLTLLNKDGIQRGRPFFSYKIGKKTPASDRAGDNPVKAGAV
ncbi:hypothetical protein B0I26_102350 [Anoxybacillus vitaminiphilus]|jgi:hypothetical protein|uniref:Uncharacterized protein n=1 Tax=Paranoxybacillus vitaminiphilus TaxID=581036 RepID=A0A327YN29_9BACL|nr:hypothetical protein B0I26_102350 [Anoxybacillus vitaminiphilus]